MISVTFQGSCGYNALGFRRDVGVDAHNLACSCTNPSSVDGPVLPCARRPCCSPSAVHSNHCRHAMLSRAAARVYSRGACVCKVVPAALVTEPVMLAAGGSWLVAFAGSDGGAFGENAERRARNCSFSPVFKRHPSVTSLIFHFNP